MRLALPRFALSLMLVASLLAVAPPAFAHPEACETKDAAAAPSEAEGEEGECFTDAEIAAMDDSGAQLAEGETAQSKNMIHLANLPKSGPFAGTAAFGSDLAFWGDYAFQGNYNGFQVTDISDPESPAIVSQVDCPGSQNDISVWRNLVFTSTDSRRSDNTCDSFALGATTTPSSTDPEAEYWEGIKVFDWSNPASPELVTTVETDCGSHTHTVVPDGDRVLLYVSSYDTNPNAKDCRRTDTPHTDHDKISIVEVPVADPAAARVIAEPVLFPDGGANAVTRGCHDITVYPAIDLAAGACMGQGVLLDIADPADPQILDSVTDANFAFWHSATFSNDGSKIIFTDELGGGGQPTCNPTVGDQRGADAIYAIDGNRLEFLSYFKIPRTQTNTENCVAHNGIVLPTADRDLFVQAWYQGGTSVIDFTDARNPREIGYFERGPINDETLVLGGAWSSYFYRGNIYVNDIQEGLDVLRFTDPVAAKAVGARPAYLNAQTQEPIAKSGRSARMTSAPRRTTERACRG